ncbi:DUF5317 domain-containing protein [Candidatus Caldatribacterium sp.]|uniref:DUF5317 domain-containing protein n=1 Tax=Candidatus Caldatribacterium sp. TaxID=2282143 RepID=UPI00299BBBD7|nr:DUF5317 domain-containing protein [Candidatus Caldatribacterium sp.]MDW8081333.1 DUF5317 domain-containing protein [Candidatus Calescibacterium sp.]
MMLVDFFLAGLLLGLLFGGKLARLSQIPLMFFWLVVAGFSVRFFALGFSERLVPLFQTVGMALVFVGTLFGLRLFGMPFVALGAFCNFLVVAVNGGRMPASKEMAVRLGLFAIADRLQRGVYPEYVLMGETTRLHFLGDLLPYFSLVFRRPFVVSAGDYLLGIGVFLILFHYLRKGEGNGEKN